MPYAKKTIKISKIHRDSALLREYVYGQPYNKVAILKERIRRECSISRSTLDHWLTGRNHIRPLYQKIINSIAGEQIFPINEQ